MIEVPILIIEEARCTHCGRRIVSAREEGNSSGWRLTDGCKATLGGEWTRVPPGPEFEAYTKVWQRLEWTRGGSGFYRIAGIAESDRRSRQAFTSFELAQAAKKPGDAHVYQMANNELADFMEQGGTIA